MAEPVRRDELRAGPGRRDGRAVRPGNLGVVPIVDDERRQRQILGESREIEDLRRGPTRASSRRSSRLARAWRARTCP